MLHENDLILIESYLDGELEGDQLRSFEQRLENEPELSEEMQLFKEVNTHLAEAHKVYKKEEWKAIINQAQTTEAQTIETQATEAQPKASRRRILYLVASAAAAALLFFGIYTLFPGASSSQDLAQQYWDDSSSFLATSIERGNNTPDSQRLANAFSQYKEKNYQGSIQILAELENTNDESDLLSAACYFQLDQSAQAIAKLLPLVNNPQAVVKDEAQWYLALAYLKDNQPMATQKLLNGILSRKSWNWQKAQSLLDQL